MGRPLVVCTPEEEAAYCERERELAHERAHRRMADPELRARDAEFKRQCREADPKVPTEAQKHIGSTGRQICCSTIFSELKGR